MITSMVITVGKRGNVDLWIWRDQEKPQFYHCIVMRSRKPRLMALFIAWLDRVAKQEKARAQCKS